MICSCFYKDFIIIKEELIDVNMNSILIYKENVYFIEC